MKSIKNYEVTTCKFVFVDPYNDFLEQPPHPLAGACRGLSSLHWRDWNDVT